MTPCLLRLTVTPCVLRLTVTPFVLTSQQDPVAFLRYFLSTTEIAKSDFGGLTFRVFPCCCAHFLSHLNWTYLQHVCWSVPGCAVCVINCAVRLAATPWTALHVTCSTKDQPKTAHKAHRCVSTHITPNLLHFTNIYSMLQRMNIWFSSTLDGVHTVTRAERLGYGILTNCLSLFQSFLLPNEGDEMGGACSTTGYIQEKFVHHFTHSTQRKDTTW